MRDGLPDLVQVWLAAAAAFAGREDFLFPEPQISCSKVMPHPLALSPDPPRRASRDEMEDFERPNEEERETSLVIVVQQRTHLEARLSYIFRSVLGSTSSGRNEDRHGVTRAVAAAA